MRATATHRPCEPGEKLAAPSCLPNALRVIVTCRPSNRQTTRRTMAVLCAAAALASLVFGVSRWQQRGSAIVASVAQPDSMLRSESSTALLIRGAVTRFVEPGTTASLRTGDEISVAPAGQAQLRLPSAARLVLEPATRVRVRDLSPDEAVELVQGSIALRVPRLPSSHSLSIMTPDARVVVHGTQFRVTVTTGAWPSATETSVSVTEGEVAVIVPTGHRILKPGQRWSSSESTLVAAPEPAASAHPEPPSSPSNKALATSRPITGAVLVDPTPPVPSSSSGALAEQNRIYR